MPPTHPAPTHHGGHHELVGLNARVPIFKLHRNLFWRIFMINADLDAVTGSYEPRRSLANSFNALTITRRTSQVCTQWRDLTINSPSLWGRCIDINHLNQKQPHWRNEVLRRSAQSSLHVKGDIGTPDLADILLCILDTEWARIRDLHINVRDNSTVDDLRWSALQRVAPLLRSFTLNFRRGTPNILSTPANIANIMFANNAPALDRFASDSDLNIFSKTPSWLLPLRHFDIRGPFTVPQLFDALPHMLRLKYLNIHQNPGLDSPSLSLSHIHFPYLEYIRVESTFRTCLTLLEHITPAPGCSFHLVASDQDQFEAGDRGLSTTLSRYAEGCFALHSPPELYLQIRQSCLWLSCKKSASSPEFYVKIDGRASLSPEINEIALSVLSSSPFNKVTSLTIFLVSYNFKPTNPHAVAFISSLSSLETLHTTENFLENLMTICDDEQLSDDERLFFPLLKKLKLDRYQVLKIDIISRFLFQRQELVVPVAVLEITGPLPTGVRDLEVFDNLDGLRVFWKHSVTSKEYICGSGNS